MIYLLIITIFSLIFLKSIFILFLPLQFFKLMLVILVIFLLFITLFSSHKKKFPLLLEFFLFTIAIFISCYYNNSFNLDSFTFYRYFLLSYLFFLVIVNLNLSKEKILNLIRYILILFVVQFIAGTIKLFIMGPEEKIVGLMSYSAGQLHTTIPILSFLFLFSLYWFKQIKNRNFFILFGLILLFTISGDKRGVWLYLPAILFIQFLFYNKYYLKRKFNLKNYLIVSIFAVLVLLFGLFINPSFKSNSNKIIDLNHATTFVYNYSFYNQDTESFSGRLGGLYILVNDLFTDRPNYYLKTEEKLSWLLGLGPDIFAGDMYLEDSNLTYENKGIRYIPTGIYRQLLISGLLGSILLFVYLFKFYSLTKNYILTYQSSLSNFGKSISLTLLSYFLYVFLFEYLTYSFTYMTDLFYIPLFFLGLIINKNEYFKKIEE